jgi:hypoxanthine-guanine phosphoribosyltransferase
MLAIKKLQDQNEELKSKTTTIAAEKNTETYSIIFLILIIITGGIYFYSKLRKKA